MRQILALVLLAVVASASGHAAPQADEGWAWPWRGAAGLPTRWLPVGTSEEPSSDNSDAASTCSRQALASFRSRIAEMVDEEDVREALLARDGAMETSGWRGWAAAPLAADASAKQPSSWSSFLWWGQRDEDTNNPYMPLSLSPPPADPPAKPSLWSRYLWWGQGGREADNSDSDASQELSQELPPETPAKQPGTWGRFLWWGQSKTPEANPETDPEAKLWESWWGQSKAPAIRPDAPQTPSAQPPLETLPPYDGFDLEGYPVRFTLNGNVSELVHFPSLRSPTLRLLQAAYDNLTLPSATVSVAVAREEMKRRLRLNEGPRGEPSGPNDPPRYGREQETIVAAQGWIPLNFTVNPEPSSAKFPALVVLKLPGNPGIIDYYDPYLGAIFRHLGASVDVYGLSYLCHTRSTCNGHLYNVEGQAAHAAAALDLIMRLYPPTTKVLILSHSTGALLTLRLMDSPEAQARVAKMLMVFPAIDRLRESPRGISMRQVHQFPRMTARAVTMMRGVMGEELFGRLVRAQVHNSDRCAAVAMQRFLFYNQLSNACWLFQDTCRVTESVDRQRIAHNAHRMAVYYTTADGWIPRDRIEELSSIAPAAEVHVITDGTPHDFVYGQSVQMGAMIAARIARVDLQLGVSGRDRAVAGTASIDVVRQAHNAGQSAERFAASHGILTGRRAVLHELAKYAARHSLEISGELADALDELDGLESSESYLSQLSDPDDAASPPEVSPERPLGRSRSFNVGFPAESRPAESLGRASLRRSRGSRGSRGSLGSASGWDSS